MNTFFDDLDTDPMASASTEAIRKSAHIVNGGDRVEAECPGCRGTGYFRSYTGRTVGKCFKCKGAGKVSNRVAGAAKAKVTKAANEAAYREQYAAEIEFCRKGAKFGYDFYQSLLEKLNTYGKFTDNQLAAIHRAMAKCEEMIAAKKAEKTGKVDISAIEKLFDGAVENKIKRPIFRTENVTLSRAPATGRNPGAIYVKGTKNGEYLGKIVGGVFHGAYSATTETINDIRAVAVDPTAEAIKYGRKTGNCGCCGRQLVNPVSILAGVGPICASRWNLDWKRDLATEEYAQMKAEEAGE